MARPKIEIDEIQVETLAAMQCTNQEIADVFSCSVDTLTRRFADALRSGRSMGVMTMKRKLFEKVQIGDLGAIIWWSKNFAGMADKIEQKVQSVQETTFKIGWQDELDELNPPEKDATPAPDPEVPETIQESSVGAPVGENN